MISFLAVLEQMLYLFTCILIGYFLRKINLVPDGAASVVSKIENYVCIPAIILSVTLSNNDIGVLIDNSVIILYSAGVIFISCVIGYILAPKLAAKPEHIGIFLYSLVFPNFGFMGLSVVQGLFGDDVLFAYFIYKFPVGLVLYSLGIAWLTGEKGNFTLKKLLNPAFFAMILGMIAGFSGLKLPSFLDKTVSGLAACYSPLAMILTGIVIAKYDFRMLFRMKNVYLVTLIRMILMPLMFFGLCQAFHVPSQITMLIMIFSSMPLGLNTIVIPAATGGDETPGASMAVISNLIGLITVPLLLSLVI